MNIKILTMMLLFSIKSIAQIPIADLPKPIYEKKLSDETLIKSSIFKLKQSVKNQDCEMFLDVINDNITDSTMVINNKKSAKKYFQNSISKIQFQNRSAYFNRRTPRLKNIKPTWDFEIDIRKIDIYDNYQKAELNCDIYFKMEKERNSNFNNEKIMFEKVNKKWKIIRFNNFVKYINNYDL